MRYMNAAQQLIERSVSRSASLCAVSIALIRRLSQYLFFADPSNSTRAALAASAASVQAREYGTPFCAWIGARSPARSVPYCSENLHSIRCSTQFTGMRRSLERSTAIDRVYVVAATRTRSPSHSVQPAIHIRTCEPQQYHRSTQ